MNLDLTMRSIPSFCYHAYLFSFLLVINTINLHTNVVSATDLAESSTNLSPDLGPDSTKWSSSSSSLTISIPSSNLLPNPVALLSSGTHATLIGLSLPPSGEYGNLSEEEKTKKKQKSVALSTPLTRSSTLEFHDLHRLLFSDPDDGPTTTPRSPNAGEDSSTSFLLDIRSRDFVFAPLRVDIAHKNGSVLGVWETFRGHPWENRGAEKFAPLSALSGPQAEAGFDTGAVVGTSLDRPVMIEARVLARRSFYEERPKFSIIGLFKNPMILLALVSSALLFGMPKLLENMDPEMRAEFEKQSRASPLSSASRSALAASGPGGGAGDFNLAGWMAGATSGPSANIDSALKGGATSKGVATGRDVGGSGRRRG